MNTKDLANAISQTVNSIAYLRYVNCWAQVLVLQKHLEQLLEMQRNLLASNNEKE
jgi:hypothetical protein